MSNCIEVMLCDRYRPTGLSGEDDDTHSPADDCSV
mgnify:CR=1 FL=1